MWDFKSKILTTKQLRCLHIFVIDPLLMLLFLTKYPKGISNQMMYVTKWVGVSTLVEWFAEKKLQVVYFDNGWHIGWSVLIYIKMYLYSLLILKNKLVTLVLSIISTTFFVLTFKVPVKQNLNEYLKFGKRLVKSNSIVKSWTNVFVTLLAVLIGIRTLQKVSR